MRRIFTLALSLTAVVIAGCGVGDSDRSGPDPEVPFDTAGWRTDFSVHAVPLGEFLSGGPPKDGIPSIDSPKFVSVEGADHFLAAREPVAVLELDGEVRAYPIQVLIWHEIVNDVVAGNAVAVTYCPLCNSTVAFRRELDGTPVEFGTTGMLRNSDLVMYDRDGESWWQQLTAEAIVGERTGETLEVLPTQILAWKDVRGLHPDADVLSRDTGFDRAYGSTPYVGYEGDGARPFAYDGPLDDALPAKERVSAVRTASGSPVVYPFSRLREEAPLNDTLDGAPIVVLFDPGVVSALDATQIATGASVGAAGVFDRRVGGLTLRFEAGDSEGVFHDRETGSTWTIAGCAIAGKLKGKKLSQIPSDDQFWFAVAAFFEDREIRG